MGKPGLNKHLGYPLQALALLALMLYMTRLMPAPPPSPVFHRCLQSSNCLLQGPIEILKALPVKHFFGVEKLASPCMTSFL